MLSYPIDNISVGCANEDDCFRNATCQITRFAPYKVCNCPGYYNPLSRCNDTIFDYLGNEVFIYGALGLITYISFIILFTMELLTDFKRKLLRIAMISKGALIMFTPLRIAHFSQWIYTAQYTMYPSLPIIDTVLRSTGVIFLGSFGVLSVTIAWCDILLRAKKLGDHSITIKKLRITLIVVVSVITPISFTINIISSFNANISFLGIMGNLLGGISILVALSITTYLLVIVYRWVKKMKESNPESRSLIIVVKKTRWLIAINVNILITFVMIAVFVNLPREIPHWSLIIESITRIVELISLVYLYGFLESYLFSKENRPFLGYIYILAGQLSLIDSSGNNATSPPSSVKKSTTKTKTTENQSTSDTINISVDKSLT